MEPSKESITSRKDRLNSQIVGKIVDDRKLSLINRESLFDALQALFDECGIEAIQKYDKQIVQFYEKYKQTILELKRLRVNITDFEIKDVIGRGHFGEVHVVKEKHNGDIYAMKTLRKCDSLEKTAFDTERDIMAFAQSPWITFLQYAFQDNTCLYFVMEYHPGGDLLGLLFKQGGTLPESAASFYLAEIVLALGDLHKMGFVHRDIKPDNVLLDRCGHLKLVDFGSAAKLNKQGFIDKAMPVGTPDYVAPEVLRSAENKNNKKTAYGVSCDFWSLGIVAYELAVGKPPFCGSNTVSTYARIMSHTTNLKFPSDVLLTQAYISFIQGLLVEEKSRLNIVQIKQHVLFKNIHFDTIRDQVPPFVPNITSLDDTSNFTDMGIKKSGPSSENFKKKTQFSGRNLPFVGFTYTHDFNNFAYENSFNRSNATKDEIIKNMKEELEIMKRDAMKKEDFDEVKLGLEKKILERGHKLENIESVRNKLERELAGTIAELAALKRTLEFERKDRLDLERKALDLIKSAKIKWETSERTKTESLNLKIEQQQEEINKLSATNNLLSEQLERAFKAENMHKQSLAAVEQLGRRSVIGLQSHLEEVSLENQVKIKCLHKQYDEALNDKKQMEIELSKAINREKSLVEEIKRAKGKAINMYNSAMETENLVKELNNKVNELEKEIDNTEHLKININRLTDQVTSCENNIRELQNANILLKNENRNIEEHITQIDSLKQIKTQHEKTINELESKLQEEIQKNAALKQQQNQESESLTDESQELKELKMKIWRMEKEFSNTKIDKRIVERELKDAEKQIKELNVEITQVKQKSEEIKKIHESAMLELSNINEGLSLDLFKIRGMYKSSEEKLETEKCKLNEQKDFITQLKNTIHDKDINIMSLSSKESAVKEEKMLLENNFRLLQAEKLDLEKQIGELKKDDQLRQRELDDYKRRFNTLELNFEALREACVLIENQVIEYERINASIQAEKSVIVENTEKLIKDLCKAKEDIQEAKKMANEEKSLRLLAESKIKRLNEDMKCLQDENVSYKNEGMKYRDYANNLKEELTSSEKHVTDLDVQMRSHERVIEETVMEINVLKEEISQYLTQIAGFKESNFKCKQQIEDHKQTNNMLMMRLNELETELNIKINYYEEREVKHDSTIKQQTKLIDYLQVKLDEHTTKKRTLTDKLFGSSKKENQNPLSLPVNYKDLEAQLQKLKQVNKSLQDEIFKLKTELTCKTMTPKVTRHKSEIVSPQTKHAIEQLVKSPISSKSEVSRHSSKERMYHNIPHRFTAKLCKTLAKCDHCANQIPLGRDMSVCNECSACVHVSCADSLKGTCSLPKAFAKHFRDSLSKLQTPNENDGKNKLPDTIEGWIKVLSKNNSWERRYASLSDSYFNVYTNSSKANNVLEHSIDLNALNVRRKVILEPLQSEIGVSVAKSDLPFVIKFEVSSDCWPMGSLVFMALSMEDRDKWFKALEKRFINVYEKYNIESIMTLCEDVYPNCIIDLTKNIIAIGADQGLYAYFNEVLVHLEGLSDVQQIGLIPETNVVVMVAGTNGKLISCDLNHLINLIQCATSAKPVLKYKNITIKDLDGFHFLQTSNTRKHQMFCAATSKQLVIVQFDLDSNDFIPLRIMDTAEPLGCALFTEHTLIVGVDKFFEIDLSSFQAEEFLDSSDLKLKPLVKCHKLQSFPLAIVQTCDNPKEYLLCFNELAVFVDEYGRSSRSAEVKSSHLPIGFQYINSYLYIIQFTGVEILKLSEDAVKDEFPTITIDLKKMRYLGNNKKGIYVFHNQKIKLLEGNKLINLDDSSSTISSIEMEESDRFSFTSSMVQSLDGNLSDIDSTSAEEINVNKKVTFSSETNL